MGHRDEGAVLKEENKRRCEGTFSAGVSDGRLRSLAQGFVFWSLFHATVSLPLCGCTAFTLIHTSVFRIGRLSVCTCVLAVCCIVTCSCSVRSPPTSHPVLSSPIACQFAEQSDIERQALKVQVLQFEREKPLMLCITLPASLYTQ